MIVSIERVTELLRGYDNVLILTHQSPDGDTVGCAAALCEALRCIGKTAYILENFELTEALARFAVRFHAPENFAPNAVISVDVADLSLLQKNAEQYAGKIDLCIDHHCSNRGYAAAVYVDGDAAACAEPVYELIKLLGVPLSRSIAAALYLAESTDTGGFRYSSVTSRSMRYGADFIETGIEFYDINRQFLELRSKRQLELESFILTGCEYNCDGKLVIASLTADDYRRLGIEDSDTSNISSFIRSIEGVVLGVFMRERERGKWRVSLRSERPYSAGKVAGELGGGGHFCAAGATVEADFEQVLRLVRAAGEAEVYCPTGTRAESKLVNG